MQWIFKIFYFIANRIKKKKKNSYNKKNAEYGIWWSDLLLSMCDLYF